MTTGEEMRNVGATGEKREKEENCITRNKMLPVSEHKHI